MTFPSAGRLGLLSDAVNAIRVSPDWVVDHAVLIDCPLESLEFEDEFAGDDGEAGFEVIFEPDFSLDDDDDDDDEGQDVAAFSEKILALLDDDDEEDDEENWPS